jgi:hypothetical protein
MCCVKGESNNPGSNNFDLEDNIFDLNAGRTILESQFNGLVADLGQQI